MKFENVFCAKLDTNHT